MGWGNGARYRWGGRGVVWGWVMAVDTGGVGNGARYGWGRWGVVLDMGGVGYGARYWWGGWGLGWEVRLKTERA